MIEVTVHMPNELIAISSNIIMQIIETFTIQIEKENYLFIVINTYIVTVLINTISSCQITYGIKKKTRAVGGGATPRQCFA